MSATTIKYYIPNHRSWQGFYYFTIDDVFYTIDQHTKRIRTGIDNAEFKHYIINGKLREASQKELVQWLNDYNYIC